MNPLQEYPHLFANGKFKVRWDHESVDFIEDVNLRKEFWLINNPRVLSNCTLIARPIADMTDEECTESVLFDCLKDKVEPNHIRQELIKMNSITRTIRLSLYLLSIGVYPFDQSHFEDGTVIDATGELI